MGRRLGLCLLLLLVLAGPAAGGASDRRHRIDYRIDLLESEIAQASAREGVLTSEISTVTSKIRALKDDVGQASSELSVLERELALHREKLQKLTELLDFETRRLVFLRAQFEQARKRLNVRLVSMYETERLDTVAVVLSASSLRDLIDQLDYLDKVSAQDRRIAGEVARAKEEMRRARERTKRTHAEVAETTRAISARTDRARLFRDRLLASQEALADARRQKQQTLASVRADKQEFIAEVEALQAQSSALAAQIQTAQAGAPPGVPSASGLIWPVSGAVTSTFGMRWGRMHEGIDIAAPSGTPVRAAASGTVISAGWLGGYGNLVVIDHGGGLATAYAHLSGFAVGSGAAVGQASTLGYVGCTGHCTGPHLHFEVRVNGIPVDPLGYL